jgi:hypothetical protein
MNDISEVLGILTPSLFTDKEGKEWQVAPPTKKIQGQFSEWLKMKAKQEIFASAGDVSEEVMAAMLLRFSERSARGLYGFFSSFAGQMIGKPDGEGLVRLFWLCTSHYVPTLTEEQARKLFMDNASAKEAINDMLTRSKNAVALATQTS